MENQEKSETSFVPRKNLIPNQYKWDYCLIAIPVICIILFPLGVLFYFCGRINFNQALIIMGIYPFVLLLMPVLFLINVVRLTINVVRLLRKNTWKKIFLTFIGMFLPVLFVFLFLAPFYFKFNFSLWGSKDPFLFGFRDLIKNKIDVEKTQSWLKTISEEYFTADQGWINLENIPDKECPEYLKKRLHSVYIYNPLREDEFGNPIIMEITGGGGFFHWGYVIGLPDLIYSEDQINEKRKYGEELLLVQPGFYVWAQG